MSDTRRIILETLSQRGPLPIDEIAHAVRHSTLATRYHLGLLIDEGLVAADQVAHRPNVGRPQALYALAEQAREHLPKQYNWLALHLLDEIGDSLGEKEKRALLRRVGKKIASIAPTLRKSARIETRLEHTISFLQEHGYLARWEKIDGDYALHVCNCPYRQVALEHREVCDMDVTLVGELLKMPIKMTTCLANQDSSCSFVVRPNDIRNKR
ncbi:MAG: ArsR family transcriptional regulator [Chloroflexi bacterium]|nr:ArsR family transcriptional regulator [Chloroflexota bacterium]